MEVNNIIIFTGENMDQSQIFRKKSIEKITSPEKLDD